ncbi:hypothetical protein [Mycolicibacterium duvalii]|uniref:SAM-dependent methyltransferase n=1 Tax=Mycolicibacterium duvalii TaxID=39688 RepID=A0A7I7K3F4_9MYCO|nr:hypothetical protein [Mycolicibacterium duvalii]MCV7370618.1 hypothetical protein [Mycolicibacterium duvalii]BBX17999.1 hypothetical protein MDUV_28590 [Mycolicibacterium duvalii]
MLPTEAAWIGNALRDVDATDLSPVLNLGSSTVKFRTIDQPHIHREIFAPLAARNIRVIHSDLKQQEGVEIAGDILDPAVQAEIRKLGVRSVMCNNMLEHVTDIDGVCAALAQICPPNGLLFVSVPHEYPFHPDPIDNGFRPNLEELARVLGPGFELRKGQVVNCGNYKDKIRHGPGLLRRDLKLVIGARDPIKMRILRENYRFWTSQYKISCAVFARGGK